MSKDRSSLDKVIAFAGGTWTGLVLLGALFIYLGAATFLSPPEASERWLCRFDLYAAWPLKLLLGLLITNILVATLYRLRPGLAHLGAWLAHFGVVVLAVGSAMYATRSVSGLAVAGRPSATQPFAAVEHFFIKGTAALYVWQSDSGQVRHAQNPLGRLKAGTLQAEPLQSPDKNVSLTPAELMPSALPDLEWRDDGPAVATAAELLVRDGQQTQGQVVSNAYAQTRQAERAQYAINVLEPVEWSSPPQPKAVKGKDTLTIWPRGEYTVAQADGGRRKGKYQLAQEFALTLGGRELKLTVQRFMERSYLALAPRPGGGPLARPALRVQVKLDQWEGPVWVMYQPVLAGPEAFSPFNTLPLGGGRALSLAFAPQAGRLPVPFAVTQVQPAEGPSGQPTGEVISTLAPIGPDNKLGAPRQCRLNQPADLGPLRVFAGDVNWPLEMYYQVTTRPGLWSIWAGCLLVLVALPYSFWLKPLLLRREMRA
jgi:hypothetical protein